MSTKLLAAAMLFCSVAYGAPSTTIVGTATVRGNMHVDGNQVTGDATLFDGSTVETAAASATLRMDQHSIIEMATGSRVIVHESYVTLEQGSIDIKPVCGFVVETNGVRVTPNSPNAHAMVSNGSVSSHSGEFFVLDSHGRILSRVRGGSAQSLGANQAQSAGAATYVGNLSILDRHPLLTLLAPDAHTTYELQGKDVDKIRGNLVEVDGTIDPKRNSALIEVGAVIAHMKTRPMCAAKAPPYWLLGSAAAAAGIGAGIATNEPSTPASR